jgi:heptosyltransferase-2/heptosyltransferase-3
VELRSLDSAQEFVPVIRFGALGDLIVTLPLLHALQERHGRPCLLIGRGWWPEPVCRGNPDVGRVICVSRRVPFPFDMRWWSAVAAVRRCRELPVYDLCETPGTRPVERLLGLAGVEQSRRLSHRDCPPSPGEHSIERLLRVCTPGGDAQPTGSMAPVAVPRLVVLESERRARERWLEARGWSGRAIVLVQAGNRRTMSSKRDRHRRLSRDDKAWPTECWRQLLHAIHARLPDAIVLLCGAASEAPFIEEIRQSAALACVAGAVLDLRSLFALCEIAHSMISIDTGPAHAAAALGVPLVVLFGAHSPAQWLPRSAGSPVIGLGGPPEFSRVDQIPVDLVIEHWQQLVQHTPSRRTAQGSQIH